MNDRRRVLYVLTGVAWVGVALLVGLSIREPDATHDVLLMVATAIASCLFTATLFVIYLRPVGQAYRLGVRDGGQRTSGCSMYRPVLAAVNDRPSGDRPVATIVPLRSRSDNQRSDK